MTSSAPIDRTSSMFLVLHTAVTRASSDLAICTANVPTPPAAPLMRTCCPLRILPLSQALQRGDSGDGYGCGLLPGDVFRFESERRCGGAHVFGEGAFGCPEDRITRFECGDVAADGFDDSSYVCAEVSGFGRAQAGEKANERRGTADKVPIVGVD